MNSVKALMPSQDEFLRGEKFSILKEGKILIEHWSVNYNTVNLYIAYYREFPVPKSILQMKLILMMN